MLIKLGIEHNWVEEGINGKIIRRAVTFEEAIEFVCENCQDDDSEIEMDIDEESILVCRDCAKQITNIKLTDPDFIGNIGIQIL